jgi:hypothetical protein
MEGCGRPTSGWPMSMRCLVLDLRARHRWRRRRQPGARSFAKIQAGDALGLFGQPEGVSSPVDLALKSHTAFVTAQALDACHVILFL